MVPEVAELEDLRKDLGLAQIDIANQLDVPMSTYQGWVYDDVRPSYDGLKKINDYLEKKKSAENMK